MGLLQRLFNRYAETDVEGWSVPIMSHRDRLTLYQQMTEGLRSELQDEHYPREYSRLGGLCKDASARLVENLVKSGMVAYVWSFGSDKYDNHSVVIAPHDGRCVIIDPTITQFFSEENQFVFPEDEYRARLRVPPHADLQEVMEHRRTDMYYERLLQEEAEKQWKEKGLLETKPERLVFKSLLP